jgi:hypothetical protein
MTDEQMLNAAANAAGIWVGWYDGALMTRLPKANGFAYPWNPLDDDGDAFRLAAQLGIAVSIVEGDVYAAWWSDAYGLLPALRLRPTAPVDAHSRTAWLRRAVVMLAAGVVSGANTPETTP